MIKITHRDKAYPDSADLIFTGVMNRPPESVTLVIDHSILPPEAAQGLLATFKDVMGRAANPDQQPHLAKHRQAILKHAPNRFPPPLEATRILLSTDKSREELKQEFTAALSEHQLRLGGLSPVTVKPLASAPAAGGGASRSGGTQSPPGRR